MNQVTKFNPSITSLNTLLHAISLIPNKDIKLSYMALYRPYIMRMIEHTSKLEVATILNFNYSLFTHWVKHTKPYSLVPNELFKTDLVLDNPLDSYYLDCTTKESLDNSCACISCLTSDTICHNELYLLGITVNECYCNKCLTPDKSLDNTYKNHYTTKELIEDKDTN